jgi:hypothetical protein
VVVRKVLDAISRGFEAKAESNEEHNHGYRMFTFPLSKRTHRLISRKSNNWSYIVLRHYNNANKHNEEQKQNNARNLQLDQICWSLLAYLLWLANLRSSIVDWSDYQKEVLVPMLEVIDGIWPNKREIPRNIDAPWEYIESNNSWVPDRFPGQVDDEVLNEIIYLFALFEPENGTARP